MPFRSHDEFADHLDALDRADDAAAQAADDWCSENRYGGEPRPISDETKALTRELRERRERRERMSHAERLAESMAAMEVLTRLSLHRARCVDGAFVAAADLKRRSGQPLTAMDAAALVEGVAA